MFKSHTRVPTQQDTVFSYMLFIQSVNIPGVCLGKPFIGARFAWSGKERGLNSIINLFIFYNRLSTCICTTMTSLLIFIHVNWTISHNLLKDQKCHLVIYIYTRIYKANSFCWYYWLRWSGKTSTKKNVTPLLFTECHLKKKKKKHRKSHLPIHRNAYSIFLTVSSTHKNS